MNQRRSEIRFLTPEEIKARKAQIWYSDGFSDLRYSSEDAARRARIMMLEHQTGVVTTHVYEDGCYLCVRIAQQRGVAKLLKQKPRELILSPKMKRAYSADYGSTPSELAALERGVYRLPSLY